MSKAAFVAVLLDAGLVTKLLLSHGVQDDRQKHHATVKIQAAARGYIARCGRSAAQEEMFERMAEEIMRGMFPEDLREPGRKADPEAGEKDPRDETSAHLTTPSFKSSTVMRAKQMREVSVAERALQASTIGHDSGQPVLASFCDFIEALVRWTYVMRGWDVGAEHRTESFVNALQITIESMVARKLNPGQRSSSAATTITCCSCGTCISEREIGVEGRGCA